MSTAMSFSLKPSKKMSICVSSCVELFRVGCSHGCGYALLW